MLSTKSMVHDFSSIPVTFIFEHFCKLSEKLTGQRVVIKSLWNDERTPSLCIYMNDQNTYMFNDFSSGKKGSAVSLVMELYQVEYRMATYIIQDAYNDYLIQHGSYEEKESKKQDSYKVSDYHVREWNALDQSYWTAYNIGTALLNSHHVKPLLKYRMSKKDENGTLQEITIRNPHMYGFFSQAGELYKIYQPNTDRKFIKVGPYLQGEEQLKGHPYLIITSSLKDLMSFKSLGLSVDCIAPDSENTMIPYNKMEDYLQSYRQVMTCMDNDEAGITAMRKYKDRYDLEPILLPMCKDVSDSIKKYGVKEVRRRLVPIINRKINLEVETH